MLLFEIIILPLVVYNVIHDSYTLLSLLIIEWTAKSIAPLWSVEKIIRKEIYIIYRFVMLNILP